MPAFLVTWVGKRAAPFVLFGGIALVLLMVVGGIYWAGHSSGKTGEVNKELTREVKVQEKIGDASTNAADARVGDATLGAKEQQEVIDAVRNAKNPDDARALRGCVILRQQGRDTSRIPACGRFGAAAGAAVPR